MSIARRLTTRPIWWWERHHPYLIRKKWRQLPTISTTNDSRAPQLVVLTTESMLDESAWSAWSWAKHCKHCFSVRIVVDGNIANRWLSDVSDVLPNVSVEKLSTIISGQHFQSASIANFTKKHPLGKKLALILSLQEQTNLLFSDSDVLVFSSPVDLLSCVKSGSSCFNAESGPESYDDAIVARGLELGMEPAIALNSGLLYMQKQSIDSELVCRLLEGWQNISGSWFTEQTLLSYLLNNVDAVSLPTEKYVVSNQRQFFGDSDVDYSSIHTRHFTGTVRHLMYLKGMPAILKDISQRRSKSSFTKSVD